MEDSPGMRRGKKENHLKTILDIGSEILCHLGRKRELSRNELIFHASEKSERNGEK